MTTGQAVVNSKGQRGMVVYVSAGRPGVCEVRFARFSEKMFFTDSAGIIRQMGRPNVTLRFAK